MEFARLTTSHEEAIRQALSLAISAGKHGNHTFGALLVHQGHVILTAENTVNTDNDQTRHAELNLVVEAQRQFSREVLQECTLYTSTAPCLMCGAVIHEAGINHIVFSVSYQAFTKLIPGIPGVPGRYRTIPVNEVFASLGTTLEIIGPVLEEDGLQVFRFWPIP